MRGKVWKRKDEVNEAAAAMVRQTRDTGFEETKRCEGTMIFFEKRGILEDPRRDGGIGV